MGDRQLSFQCSVALTIVCALSEMEPAQGCGVISCGHSDSPGKFKVGCQVR